MGKINFIYQVTNNKHIIWKIVNWKITNKRYYFDKIEYLNFENNIILFLQDYKFNFCQKTFDLEFKKKFSIKNIDKSLEQINIDYIPTWYYISNIVINWKKTQYILWQTWQISYTIWVYWLNSLEYNNILKIFWKNIRLNILPNSIYTIRYIFKDIDKWNIIYMLDDNTKIIKIKNWFYTSIEVLNIWLEQLLNNINDIFWTNKININNFSTFHKKIYITELNRFLEPIILFIKNNLTNDKAYIIWNFKYIPNLLYELWKKTKNIIAPIKINNKTFKTTEEIDLFCISQNLKQTK